MMPIPTDPAAATGLPADTHPGVMPFLRAVPADPGGGSPSPHRPSNVAAIDGLSEIRAMVGLISLAAEALPAPYAGEFGAVLEQVHAKLGATVDLLRRGSGRPPLDPVGA